MPLISEPTAIAIYLIVLIGVLHRISEYRILASLFKYLPPAIWVYFLPMVSSNIGVIPQSSPVYDWIRLYLLPAALVLMLLAANIPAMVRLGGKALMTMIVGTAGIAVGAVVSFILFHWWLPKEAWKGFGALTGSWIGGSANMIAVATSIGTPDSMLGPIIVVDTVVGYGWMGVVIALAVFQQKLDARNKVDIEIVTSLNKRMRDIDLEKRRPIKFLDLTMMMAVAFGVGYAMLQLGTFLPDVGAVLNSYGWAVILATFCGVGLSFTRLSELEYAGASTVGNFLFYFLLASIGARASFQGILDAPLFLVSGATIIGVHATFLWLAGRLFRAPMFLMACASQANIGGPVTAPIVATVYQNSLAVVGLLMAVLGGIMGTFVGLSVSQICFWIAG
ncbi:MAG: DUF819 family protein [Ignavibacteriales bacterium]|nr:DUF819 family protein [Ignavibacteriales bacterium]